MNVPSRKVNRAQSATAGTQWPQSWDVEPHGISVGRYIDPAFTRLEYERLWSRVWQPALVSVSL